MRTKIHFLREGKEFAAIGDTEELEKVYELAPYALLEAFAALNLSHPLGMVAEGGFGVAQDKSYETLARRSRIWGTRWS